MTPAPPLERALFYASLGWKVFPVHSVEAGLLCTCGDSGCNRIGKHPRTTRGLKDATDDEETIRGWWARWPDANIGVRTGEESGIWVLDIDPGKGGRESFAQLADRHPPIETVFQVTGSGGSHLVFAWDEEVPPARTRTNIPGPDGEPLDGVDVRGAGGYIVAPPSAHASGNFYAWGPDASPDDRDPAPAPAWLLELACADGPAGGDAPAATSSPAAVLPAAEVASLRSALEVIPSDDYHTWLRVGMALHATGAGEQAFGIWSDWSRTSPEKFDPKVQRKKWWSFRKRNTEITVATIFGLARSLGWVGQEVIPASSPNGAAPATGPVEWARPEDFSADAQARAAFPIETAFPTELSWLRDFVVELARSRQVPVDLPAMLTLPFATVAAAKKLKAQVFPGWRETTALWVAVAMDSGEGKSGVMRALQEPLIAWERERREPALKEIAAHDHEVQTLRAKIRTSREKVAKGKTAEESFARQMSERLGLLEADPPTIPQVFASDATTEAIAQALLENEERFLICAAEADPLDVALGRYSRTGDPNLGVWLAGHAGDAYKVSRRGRQGEALTSPELSVAISPQPGAMEALFGSRMALERGFVARFLFSLPRSLAGWRTIEEVPPMVPVELEGRWSSSIRWLLDLQVQKEPDLVGLTRGAFDRLQVFRAELEESYRDPSGRSSLLAPWYKKLAGTVVRIALALYALQLAGEPRREAIIDDATFDAAMAWVPYLEVHLGLLMGVATEDPGVPVARRLLQWLARREVPEGEALTFTRREAFDAVRRRGGSGVATVDQVDLPLGLLIEGGWIRPSGRAEVRGPRPGRPPSPRFEVRPDLAQIGRLFA